MSEEIKLLKDRNYLFTNLSIAVEIIFNENENVFNQENNHLIIEIIKNLKIYG